MNLSERIARAKLLRRQGYSYAQIAKELQVSKTTAHNLLNRSYVERRSYTHLEKARARAYEVIVRNKQARTEKELRDARETTRAIPSSKEFGKALLSMLYWAEGGKYKGVSGLRFVNTDPELLLFYVRLLRTAFPIDEEKFRVRIHLHSYHTPEEALRYWSKLLGIPRSQFGKIYVKKRSKQKKFRQNFQGICFVNYLDSGVRRELMALAQALQETVHS